MSLLIAELILENVIVIVIVIILLSTPLRAFQG